MKVDINSPSSTMTSLDRDIPSIASLSSTVSQSIGNSQEPKKYNVQELVDKCNRKLTEQQSHIQVKIHDKTNTMMILVINDSTNEIIREIPSEKMLDIMYNICTKVGVFLDEKM